MRAWEKNIRRVVPYVPGEQPNFLNMIKLNTNENPYPPAPRVSKAVSRLDTDLLRLYPSPDAKPLVTVLADYHGRKETELFVGVGSDDVLAIAFMTFFNSQKPILFPDITYSFYEVWADLYRIPYERPILDENFRIKEEDYYRDNGGIVIANPNAPTSICEGLDRIEDILKHNPDVIVILDEAYIDFGGESAASLIDRYENLLVVQTFSKSRSMAGMRIGFAMGNETLIKAMNDVKFSINSYTMNLASLTLGVEAVKDEAYFQENLKKIIDTRERMKRELTGLGFFFPDSKANFLFISHKSVSAKTMLLALREENIFVRHFAKPRIDNYLRVTIGTNQEMDRLLEAAKKYI